MSSLGNATYRFTDKNGKEHTAVATCIMDDSVPLGYERANAELYWVMRAMLQGTLRENDESDFNVNNFKFNSSIVPYNGESSAPGIRADIRFTLEYVGSGKIYPKFTSSSFDNIDVGRDSIYNQPARAINTVMKLFALSLVYSGQTGSIDDWVIKSGSAVCYLPTGTSSSSTNSTNNESNDTDNESDNTDNESDINANEPEVATDELEENNEEVTDVEQ